MKVINKITVLTLMIVLSATLFGCSTHKITERIKAAKGRTKIIGKIVSIDKLKLSTDANSPCRKNPCYAKVVVDSVISIGQGGPFLKRNDTLNVRFAFTLGKTTKKLFPNLKIRMPGLEINAKFVANIKMVAGKTSSTPAKYQIDTYQKIYIDTN